MKGELLTLGYQAIDRDSKRNIYSAIIVIIFYDY